jgi:hypothetical protein
MFGKKSYLRTLESRKRSLMAESEVNRIELAREWDELKVEAHRVKRHLRAISSIASSAALLATVASVFWRHHETPKADGHEKEPWLAAALNGARVGASLFMRVRSFMRERR